MAQIELSSLVGLTQSYIAKNYAAALIDKSKTAELKAYIGKYLYDTGYSVAGYDTKGLVERLFTEMAEYSILTKYLADPDLEEINIYGWDDVALTHLDGRIEKAEEHFFSPGHAIDIVKKLLHHSGMIIDNAAPIAQGHLPNNTRVTALKEPIVDADRGIAVSIRMLHPQRVDRENLIETDSLTDDMLAFLETCLRYGVSFVVAGRTSSGRRFSPPRKLPDHAECPAPGSPVQAARWQSLHPVRPAIHPVSRYPQPEAGRSARFHGICKFPALPRQVC